MTTLQLVQIHTPEQVTEIIEQATAIIEAWPGPPDLIEVAFSKAVDLLAQRIPIQPQQPLGFDLNALRRGSG